MESKKPIQLNENGFGFWVWSLCFVLFDVSAQSLSLFLYLYWKVNTKESIPLQRKYNRDCKLFCVRFTTKILSTVIYIYVELIAELC